MKMGVMLDIMLGVVRVDIIDSSYSHFANITDNFSVGPCGTVTVIVDRALE